MKSHTNALHIYLFLWNKVKKKEGEWCLFARDQKWFSLLNMYYLLISDRPRRYDWTIKKNPKYMGWVQDVKIE